MTPRHSRTVAVALVALLALAGLAATGCNLIGGAPSSGAIATVNGVEIPRSAVDAQVDRMKAAQPASFEGTAGIGIEKQYRASVLSGLIDIQLIKEAATSFGLSVSTEQVDQYITQLQEQYNGAAALETAMKSAGYTMETLREQVYISKLQEAVMARVTTGTISVTDAQIKAFYEKSAAQFSTPAQVHAEHILFSVADTETAQSVLAQVKNGGDFAALAKKYSKDPGSAAAGGDLGWADPSAYVPPFAGAVRDMDINEVRLVKSQFGWHIIKLLGRRAASRQTLAEATPTIKQTLENTARSDKFGAYMTDLRNKATIKILDAELEKIINQNRALNSGTGSSSTTTDSAETTPSN